MTSISRYCTGCMCCYVDNEQCFYCNLEITNDSGQCPCTNCIIKCMCELACPDFDAFKNYERNSQI